MELEIEKHALAGAGERLRIGKPAGEGELIADLVERHLLAEPRHHRLRLIERRQVERDDQAIARRRAACPALPSGDPARALARHVDQPARQGLERRGEIFILEIIHVVERLLGASDIDLLGDHQRAAAELQNLPQRHQRAQPARRARRGRAEREYAALEGGVVRLAMLAHARNPVDRVLQERRHRGAVFGTGDEYALMGGEHLSQPERVARRTGIGGEVGVEQRQRIFGKRDAGDLGLGEGEFLGRERGKPRIGRAGAQRAGDDEDFWSSHDFQTTQRGRQKPDANITTKPPAVVCPAASGLPVHPHPGRRQVHPDPLRGLCGKAAEPRRQR